MKYNPVTFYTKHPQFLILDPTAYVTFKFHYVIQLLLHLPTMNHEKLQLCDLPDHQDISTSDPPLQGGQEN